MPFWADRQWGRKQISSKQQQTKVEEVSKQSLQICAGESSVGSRVNLACFRAGSQQSMWNLWLFFSCGAAHLLLWKKETTQKLAVILSQWGSYKNWQADFPSPYVPCLTCSSLSIHYLVLVGQDPGSVRLGCGEMEIYIYYTQNSWNKPIR